LRGFLIPLKTSQWIYPRNAILCEILPLNSSLDLRKVGEELFPQRTGKGPEVHQFDKSADELMLLDLLFDRGFLPTYAFPRDVRSFVIEESKKDRKGNWRIGVKQRPEQSVDVALSEYVPGRELIVDKETYRVGGIYVDPFPGATVANRVPSLFKREQHSFAFCSNCGYTQRMQKRDKLNNTTPMFPMPISTCHSGYP